MYILSEGKLKAFIYYSATIYIRILLSLSSHLGGMVNGCTSMSIIHYMHRGSYCNFILMELA